MDNVYKAIIIASIATYICRSCGVIFSSRLNIKSDLFELIRCISIGIIVAVIFKIIFYPEGILNSTSTISRFLAGLLCIICVYFLKKSVLFSTLLSTFFFFTIHYISII